jgi:hypothetical protein
MALTRAPHFGNDRLVGELSETTMAVMTFDSISQYGFAAPDRRSLRRQFRLSILILARFSAASAFVLLA